jgi:hypothetical protein
MTTKTNRTEYRRALLRAGVPAVYAHMAAERLEAGGPTRRWRGNWEGSDLLYCGFVWKKTQEGHEFWSALAAEAA